MKPIIYNSEMVRAILTCVECGTITVEIECSKCGSTERRKTQTRRIIKIDPRYHFNPDGNKVYIEDGAGRVHGEISNLKCPYGKVGDKLYCKESFLIHGVDKHNKAVLVEYLNTGGRRPWINLNAKEWELWNNRKKPYMKTSGRFMYKSLARIFLEIIDIRAERVQDISEEDADADGGYTGILPPARQCFEELWDSINKKRGYGWDKNPWVRCISFKRVDK